MRRAFLRRRWRNLVGSAAVAAVVVGGGLFVVSVVDSERIGEQGRAGGPPLTLGGESGDRWAAFVRVADVPSGVAPYCLAMASGVPVEGVNGMVEGDPPLTVECAAAAAAVRMQLLERRARGVRWLGGLMGLMAGLGAGVLVMLGRERWGRREPAVAGL